MDKIMPIYIKHETINKSMFLCIQIPFIVESSDVFIFLPLFVNKCSWFNVSLENVFNGDVTITREGPRKFELCLAIDGLGAGK